MYLGIEYEVVKVQQVFCFHFPFIITYFNIVCQEFFKELNRTTSKDVQMPA